MKKLMLVSFFTIFIVGAAQAVPTIDVDHRDINKYIDSQPNGNPDSTSWAHENPYSGVDYEDALANSLIDWAKLTIKADDIGPTDSVKIDFQDKTDAWHYLGTLNTGTQETYTTFNLNPGWLDGVTVKAKITSDYDDTYICWSELKVASHDDTTTHTPAPGAILLCSIGVGLVGWLKRRRTI